MPSVTPGLTAPLVTNVIGTTLELAYCVIFVANSREPRAAWHSLLSTLLAFLFLVGAAVAAFDGAAARSSALGTLAACVGILMYAAPLGVAADALRYHTVEFLSLPIALCSLFCCAVWVAYSVAVQSNAIFVPNVAGLALSLMQVGVYYFVAHGRSGSPKKSRPVRTISGEMLRAAATAV